MMGTPNVLLPYQARWLADQSGVKVWEKSRRIGASWAEAGDAALIAGANAKAGGQHYFYISYNQDMTRQFIDDCAEWCRHYGLAAGEVGEEIFEDGDRSIQTYVIYMASGNKIQALSGSPRNLRSKQGVVCVDEAAFLDDLEAVLKAAFALRMWGGRVRILSTHDGDENPFNVLVQDVREGRRPYSLHRTTLDDGLREGLYQRICYKTGQTWTPDTEQEWRSALVQEYGSGADEELFCIPSRSGGRYIPRAQIEACMQDDVPVLRWTCPDGFALMDARLREAEADAFCQEQLRPVLDRLPGLPSFLGEDFGRSADLTVIWPIQRRADLSLDTPFVLELRNVPFEQQRQVLFYVADRLPRFWGAALDARGNGQYLAEVAAQRYGGNRVEQVMTSSSWYLENLPRLKAAFEDRRVTIPRNADVLEDLRAVELVRGVPCIPDTRTQDSQGGRRHGDAAVALAMAVYAAGRETLGEWQMETVPVRRNSGMAVRQGAW